MVKLPLNGLKLIAISRGIKGYESMAEDEILSALSAPESLKESEKNFDDPKISFSKSRTEKIREEIKKLQHEFSKSEIKEIK